MNRQSSTIEDMARKGKSGRPKGRKPTYIIYVRVDPRIGAALEAYLDAAEPRPSTTAVIELTLKRFLQEKGHWPPPASDNAQS